jgi:tellurite methyltransferase
MINDKKKYAQKYSASEEFAYGEPNKIVEMVVEHHDPGSALDIGSGDGRHSIFLASKGFKVKAIDTSEVALEKMRRIAEKRGVKVEMEEADIANWKFEQDYDVIVAYHILQHLSTSDALRILKEMKNHTSPNGLNAISLFTKNGDRYLMDREVDPDAFYPNEQWLKEFYGDWEVLFFEEAEGQLMGGMSRPDGTPLRNVTSKIVARKRA